MKTIRPSLLFLALASLSAPLLHAKPLKVFILAGQSNMEGHAESYTFPAIAKDPKTADLYKQMVDADGKPVVCKDVWISYAYGNFGGDPIGRKAGNLTAGWGSQHHNICKIGPEFTFGITMQKHLGEPILLIKNAWGGKSLMVDFRPPSGGEPTDPKHKENAGKFYREMMSHVKDVLADPKKVYPDYDAKEGYEIAGFVWFQGFNDLVGPYPGDPTKKSIKDYSEYSRLLACLIRDLRKDLSTPNMPFVTGVLGVGGETKGDGTEAFRNAMAAPGEMEEFKGTVANVYTHKFWPADIEAIKVKQSAATAELDKKGNVLKMRAKKGEDVKEESAKLAAEKVAVIEQALTADEKFLLKNGSSNHGPGLCGCHGGHEESFQVRRETTRPDSCHV
jgi:Carbohydrate esterase, sialic acid-specific acetylesterase